MIGLVRAVVRFSLFSCLIAVVVIIQPLVLLCTRGRGAYYVPQAWHWLACRIFGLRVDVDGRPYDGGQVMLMANHISYLDIPVLGGLVRGSFVAKQDVEGWAVFGFLSRLQQTVFISRARGAAQQVQKQLDERLLAGQDLIIFPEGTSTDGRDVRPFKSSLFSLVIASRATELYVQPVTLRVVEADGKPVERDSEQSVLDIYAWHIDMDMAMGAHLWRFSQTKGARICVTFHAPLPAKSYNDRKVLAQACHGCVKGGLADEGVA